MTRENSEALDKISQLEEVVDEKSKLLEANEKSLKEALDKVSSLEANALLEVSKIALQARLNLFKELKSGIHFDLDFEIRRLEDDDDGQSEAEGEASTAMADEAVGDD